MDERRKRKISTVSCSSSSSVLVMVIGCKKDVFNWIQQKEEDGDFRDLSSPFRNRKEKAVSSNKRSGSRNRLAIQPGWRDRRGFLSDPVSAALLFATL
eukprot:scaffold1709_cov95-Cylindrotheca_fusiformis.AAC.3